MNNIQTILKNNNLMLSIEEKAIKNLPSINSILFPKEYKLLPNTTELFELEFALYEYKFLSRNSI